ncbi:MAG: hypothetical protein ACRCT1_06770 [Microcoleaceae cyanobacterium]
MRLCRNAWGLLYLKKSLLKIEGSKEEGRRKKEEGRRKKRTKKDK